jgi:hypothetical protein
MLREIPLRKTTAAEAAAGEAAVAPAQFQAEPG